MRLSQRRTTILTSVAWLTGSTWISSGLAVARGIMFAGILGPTGYGIWSLMSSAQSLSVSADLGVQQVAVRDLARSGEDSPSIATRRLAWVTIVWGACSAVFVGAVLVLVLSATSPSVPKVVYTLPLLFMGMNGLVVAQNVARGFLRFREAATITTIAGATSLVFGSLASKATGVWGLALSQALVYGLASFFLAKTVGIGRPVLEGALPVLRRSLTQGWRLLLPNLTLQVFVSCDVLIAGLLLGAEKTGQYSVALLGSSMLAGALAGSVASVVGQHLLRSTRESKPSHALVWDTAAALALGLSVICAAGALVLPGLLRIVLPKYGEAAELIPLLLCAGYYLHSQFGFSSVFVAVDRPLMVVPLYVVLVCVNVVVDYVLVSHGAGVLGIAVGTLIVNLAFAIVHPILVLRLVPSVGGVLQIVFSVLAGGLTLGIAAWGTIPYAPVVMIAVGIVACAVLFRRVVGPRDLSHGIDS